MPNKPHKPLRIAVLASGEGHTLQALLDAMAADALCAEVACVISNNAAAGALTRARLAGIAAHHLSSLTHGAELDVALTAALQAAAPDLVVLTGYMKRLGPRLLAAFSGLIINVHPSLLPKYGGQGMYDLHVHTAVLAAGEHESGATVHYVEGDYDSGRIIAQARVPVLSDDTPATLAERVKQRERLLLIAVLQQRALHGHFGSTHA